MVAIKRRPTQQVAQTRTVSAPVRGLNYKDALPEMHPQDAVVLDNLVCRPSYLEVRKGWQDHVTGFADTVESFLPYVSATGVGKLFACAGDSIYDVTSSGTLGSAAVGSLTSAYWFSTQVSNAGGNYLLAANGVDAPQSFDGSTWSAWSVTGVTASTLSRVMVWKRRVWAVQKNTWKAWYLAADAISGALTSFTFAGIFQRGGYLLDLVSWTIDGGVGVDDYFLAFSSEGEVAVYKGSDPASASTFALEGVYFIGRPVGERFWTKLGGDVIALTVQGVVPISKFLRSGGLSKRVDLAERIQRAITQDISDYESVQGWELVHFPEQRLLLIQVPSGAVGNRYQWAMDTLTGQWSRLRMSAAVTFTVLDGELYAGHSDRVVNSWTGGLDDTEDITYTMVPAFSYFGASTQLKRFTLGRVVMESDTTPVYLTRLLRDFDQSYSFPSQVASTSASSWDSAVWDTDVWGGATSFFRRWHSLSGLAYAATQAVQGVAKGETTRLVALDYVFELGGVL